ncbi:MAG: urea transporter [Aestuariibacter sp.]
MNEFQISGATALIILVAFGVFWLLWGWLLGRGNKSITDHALAGRNVGFAFATATAMATWITSNTTLVAPQLTYQFGIWGMLGYSMAALGLILFAPLAARIKTLMPSGFTSGDFMFARFGKPAWWIFLIISLCYALGWLVSLAMAGGLLLSALSELSYLTGMSAILIICVGYTLLGGLKAVIATDFIQTIIIIVGVVIIAVVCIDQVGFSTIHQNIEVQQPELLNLLFPAAIMFFFNNVFFGIGEIFHSNVWWSRAYAFANGIGKKAYLWAGLMWLPIPIVTGFIALAAMSLDIVPPSADMVGPLVAAKLLGSAGAVFVFIIVFAALASSMDSLLAATSDLFTQDIYKKLLQPDASDNHLLLANKTIVVVLGIVAWILASFKLATLGALLNFTGAFVASTIWPIVFGLYDTRLSGKFAGLAMFFGTALGLVAYFMVGFYVAAITACVISLVICRIAIHAFPVAYDWDQLRGR